MLHAELHLLLRRTCCDLQALGKQLPGWAKLNIEKQKKNKHNGHMLASVLCSCPTVSTYPHIPMWLQLALPDDDHYSFFAVYDDTADLAVLSVRVKDCTIALADKFNQAVLVLLVPYAWARS